MKEKYPYHIWFLVMFFISVLTAEGLANAQRPIEETDRDAIDSRLVSVNTKFGLNLFKELIRQQSQESIFISPASISLALAMAYNGADRETREAMAKTLELQGMSLDDVNQANAVLNRILQNPGLRVELNIANSLWAGEGIKFRSEFIKRNEDFYTAKVTTLDFMDPKAPDTINEWVRENTRGKIGKIIDKISCDDPQYNCEIILYIINAIYFKGSWSTEFDKALTKEEDFYLLDGSRKRHPMMFQSGRYMYLQGEGFQAVSLPYGDGRLSMYLFLPEKDSNLKEFYERLNAENWDRRMSQFRSMEGSLVIPRFKLEYKTTLNDALTSLGMGIAFDRVRANFRNMCVFSEDENVFIHNVSHKSFVEVNEEGTEAAAVTSVEIGATTTAFLKLRRFNMVVDHPFFFAIRDSKTGVVLFMGSIVEPKI